MQNHEWITHFSLIVSSYYSRQQTAINLTSHDHSFDDFNFKDLNQESPLPIIG